MDRATRSNDQPADGDWQFDPPQGDSTDAERGTFRTRPGRPVAVEGEGTQAEGCHVGRPGGRGCHTRIQFARGSRRGRPPTERRQPLPGACTRPHAAHRLGTEKPRVPRRSNEESGRRAQEGQAVMPTYNPAPDTPPANLPGGESFSAPRMERIGRLV